MSNALERAAAPAAGKQYPWQRAWSVVPREAKALSVGLSYAGLVPYSSRSASTGSTRVAFRAGR